MTDVWLEPLTENERTFIERAFENSTDDNAAKWGRHLLRHTTALEEEVHRLQTKASRLSEVCTEYEHALRVIEGNPPDPAAVARDAL